VAAPATQPSKENVAAADEASTEEQATDLSPAMVGTAEASVSDEVSVPSQEKPALEAPALLPLFTTPADGTEEFAPATEPTTEPTTEPATQSDTEVMPLEDAPQTDSASTDSDAVTTESAAESTSNDSTTESATSESTTDGPSADQTITVIPLDDVSADQESEQE
jgi:hypothetical protein